MCGPPILLDRYVDEPSYRALTRHVNTAAGFIHNSRLRLQLDVRRRNQRISMNTSWGGAKVLWIGVLTPFETSAPACASAHILVVAPQPQPHQPPGNPHDRGCGSGMCTLD
jgi:hypothetical protein